LSLLIVFMVIPSQNFAAVTFRVDLDANELGIQNELWIMPGDSFTANIELIMTDYSDSINSFGFSLWWDTDELNIARPADIVTSSLSAEWTDLSYLDVQPPFINNLAQISFNSSEGPLTAVIASIGWTAGDPKTDSLMDMTLGNYNIFDAVYDANSEIISPGFEGGRVNIVPEPAGLALFLSGIGAATAIHYRTKARSFLMGGIKKKIGADLRGHA